MADDPSPNDLRPCPLCGEDIKKIAVRCKHCHADLSNVTNAAAAIAPTADFDRTAKPNPATSPQSPDGHHNNDDARPRAGNDDFEQRFLDFAYATDERLTAISVAHALKMPIAIADDRLESLAAADILHRDIDEEGGVFFSLPGHRRAAGANASYALTHTNSGPNVSLITTGTPPTEAAAVAGLVLNLCMPGVGSIVAGKPGPGIAQLALVVAGLPLCFFAIGFPMIFAAWVWGLMTAAAALQEAKRA